MPEQPRTPLALAALATIARPGLDVVATQPPREPGADFDVVGIVDAEERRWIVRSPRHAAAGAAMEGEVALLGELADAVDRGLLPFDVPRPAGFAPLPEGGRAMIYRELVGRPLDPAALTPDAELLRNLARAIAALHELSGAVVRTAGLPDYDAEGYRQRRLAEVDQAARTGHLPARLLRRWEHALEDVSLWRFATTPVHGDLAGEHVVVDGDRVVGLVDWSDACVADPADDLAWLLAQTSPAAADAVMEHYTNARGGGIDSTLDSIGTDHSVGTVDAFNTFDARATLAGELAVARWLMHGVRIRSDEVIEDAIDMLRELDESVAGAPPIGRVEPVVEPAPPRFAPIVDGPDDEQDVDEADIDEPDEREDDLPPSFRPRGEVPATDGSGHSARSDRRRHLPSPVEDDATAELPLKD